MLRRSERWARRLELFVVALESSELRYIDRLLHQNAKVTRQPCGSCSPL